MIALLAVGFFVGQAYQEQVTKSKNVTPPVSPVSVDSTTVDSVAGRSKPIKTVFANEEATIHLFETAAPSVAFITTINLQQDFWRGNVYEVPQGSGSGFVWDKDGHIVTNFHVVEGGRRFTVTLADQTTWDGKLVGQAPEKDLALLQIDAPGEHLVPLAIGSSSDLHVGQFVFAIGNPFGLDHTLTTGVISALDREIQSSPQGLPIRGVIQTDAAINPGNSGGPLLDSFGKMIGVNTQIYSPSGANAGIGFAIPVDEVKWVVPDLIAYGEVRRPRLGVELVTSANAERLGLKGALVLDVTKGGAAEKAGIRPTQRNNRGEIELGDLIVGIDNKVVASNADLVLALERYKPGQQVKVKVKRDDEEKEFLVTLQSGD